MIRCRHWAREGVEGLAGVARAERTPWHSHRHAVFGVVDRGCQTIELRAGAVAIGPGMGFALPPGLAHRCVHGRETSYRILCVDTERPLAFAVFASREWTMAFDHTFAELRNAGPIRTERLIQWAAQSAVRVGEGLRPPDYVERALTEVGADLEEEKPLAELAKRQGLSPFHLQRTFVRYVGLSPSQTRLCARIRASRRRLAEGTKPAEVAYACGFADQSHLTRTFERFMGVSPKRYQRQVRPLAGE